MKLPDNDEPLILADGTKIDPSTGKVLKDKKPAFVAVPNPLEAQKIVARTRRTVAELPAPPAQLSGVALVAFYTLFGLNDMDICIAVDNKLTIEQVKNIREQEAYTEFLAAAKENILHSDNVTVRNLFEQHATTAANKIIGLVEDDEAGAVLAFKAAQDILDRAGHRPADIVEHRHKMDDVLNIVVTRRDENNVIPTIDVTPNKAEQDG